MSKTTTQVVAPTLSQYEALIAPPPPERVTPIQLFDYEVRCYANAGIATIQDLEPLRVHLAEDGKLFLVVPPKPQIASLATLDGLIDKLAYEGKRGVNYIDPQDLVDGVVVPEGVYLMTEVDDGRAMLNVAPRDALLQLTKMRRRPFVWWEGYCLYLCFGFGIFGHHNMACASSHRSVNSTPYFYLDKSEPKFNSMWGGHAYPKLGCASCGRRRVGA